MVCVERLRCLMLTRPPATVQSSKRRTTSTGCWVESQGASYARGLSLMLTHPLVRFPSFVLLALNKFGRQLSVTVSLKH